MKRIVLIFLLLTAAVWGNQTEITSLPYTASQTGSNYSETLTVAGTKVTSTTNGINITGHDIILNLGIDTVAFAAASAATGYYGIRLDGCYNIKVNGGVILETPLDTTSHGITCVSHATSHHDVTFDGTKFIVPSGQNQHVITGTTSLYNITYNNCIIRNKVTAFTSRMSFDGGAVLLQGSGNAYGTQGAQDGYYHFKFYGCKFDTVWGGAFFFGANKVYVEYCTTYVDNRNDLYTYPSGDISRGTANCGHVVTYFGFKPGSYVKHCYLKTDTTWDGTDVGIIMSHTVGTALNPVLICSNYVDVHCGLDANYGWMNGKPFKIRWGDTHVKVFDNVFISTVSTISGSSYGPGGTVNTDINLFETGDSPFPDSFIEIYDNDIYVIATDEEAAVGHELTAVRFHSSNCDLVYKDLGNRFANNRIITAGEAFRMGGYDPDACNIQLDSNEVVFADSGWGQAHWMAEVGYWHSSLNCQIVDGIYHGDYDTLLTVGSSEGDASVFLKRTWNILVRDESETPIEGSEVKITNHYGHSFYDTTGEDGWAHILLTYWFEADYTADSTAYNPMTRTAYYGLDSSAAILDTLKHDDYTDTIIIITSDEAFIGQTPSILDSTTSSVRVRIDYGLYNDAYVDTGKFFLASDSNYSSQFDSVIIPGASDPQDSAFIGLPEDSVFYFWAIAIDKDSGITDTSIIIAVHTKSSTMTIEQTIICIDTSYYKLTAKIVITVDNTTVDTVKIWLTDASYIVIDSAIFDSPDDSVMNEFGCLEGNTGYRIFALAWNAGDAVSDYSETLSVTTEAEPDEFDNSGWILSKYLVFDSTYSMADGDSVGDDNWLTVQLYGNASLEAEGCYAQLTTPDYTDMALIHSSDTLPDEYLIRTKWGYVNYEKDAYEFPEDNGRYSYGYNENGIYLLVISDSIIANEDCIEDTWHHRRKINIDIDNSDNGYHAVYIAYFDTIQLVGMDIVRTWDGEVWDSTTWNWNVGYTYEDSVYYWIELKKINDEWTIKLYDENESLLVECDPIPIDFLSGYNAPDYLYLGEPHTDDYEGTAKLKAAYLYVLTEVDTGGIDETDFTDDFESGNITNVNEIGIDSFTIEIDPDPGDDDIYGWFYFCIANNNGDTVTLFLTNPDDWQDETCEPLVSTDNVNWTRVDSVWMEGSYLAWYQILGGDSVWFAQGFPYTRSQLNTYLDSIDDLEYVTRDTLGNSVASIPIELITINDATIADSTKKNVLLISRQHTMESTPTYLLEGLMDSILSDGTFGVNWRHYVKTFIVPMINVDGVDSGYSRHNVNGINLNRDWSLTIDNQELDTRCVHQWVDDFYDTNSIDFALDIHSSPNFQDYGYRLLEAYTDSAYFANQPIFLTYLAAYDSFQTIDWGFHGESGVTLSTMCLYTMYGTDMLTMEMGWTRHYNEEFVTKEDAYNQGYWLAEAIYDYKVEEEEPPPVEKKYIMFLRGK